jgi:AraC family transcriptional regulator
MMPRHSPVSLFPADRSLALPGFRLTKTLRPAGFRLPRHTHDHTNVSLCASGAFGETVRGKWHRITPASLVLRPAGEAHANDYSGQKASRALIFEVLPATLQSVRSFSNILETALHREEDRIAGLSLRIDSELRRYDNVSPLALESLAYEVIVMATREGSKTISICPRWLDRVKDFVHAEFRRSLAISELAAAAGVHPAYLAKCFRSAFKVSIGTYIRNLRLSHGTDLLKKDHMSIVEIAAACGFYDQSHFTRLFKARFGVTPKRFRQTVAPSHRELPNDP